MSVIVYIGADELVFNNDAVSGIHSGGFSVNSIMLGHGMSPIMTINDEMTGGGNKVSDLFHNLVIPNWALSYNDRIVGGKYKEVEHDSDSEDDDVIHDDLHEKLLELVKQHNLQAKKKLTRRAKKTESKKTTKRRK